MENKSLAKMAVTALLLAAGLPSSGQANDFASQGTFLAGGCAGSSKGCGAASGGRAGCGAASGGRAGCGSASSGRAGCGASSSGTPSSSSSQAESQAGPHFPAGVNRQNVSYDPATGAYEFPVDPNHQSGYGNYNRGGMNYGGTSYNQPSSYSSNRPGAMTDYSSGTSSYQGTSTGPGPNDGYPGSPRGSYNTNYNNGNTGNYNKR